MRISNMRNRSGPLRARRSILWSALAATMIASLLGSYSSVADGQDDVMSKGYKLKVAYIYNFLRYVTWPETAFETAESPIVIGIVGADPFGSTLEALAKSKKANGRPIRVNRIQSLQSLDGCHLVFVSGFVTTAQHSETIQACHGKSILLIGEAPNFANGGASVAFFDDADGTIGFSINVDTIKRQKLSVQAPVLKIARIVKDASN
jgi:hypothetical protein